MTAEAPDAGNCGVDENESCETMDCPCPPGDLAAGDDVNPMNCFCEDVTTWVDPMNCGPAFDESCEQRMDCDCTKRGDEWFDHNNCGDDCGAGGEKGADGDWQHPPMDGVKALCFGWDASEPTNMNQVECSAAPGDNGGNAGTGTGYPQGSCGHFSWGGHQEGHNKCEQKGGWAYPEGHDQLQEIGDAADICCSAEAVVG